MKILHVTEASSGGVGKHVIDLLREQTSAGHDVSLFYSDRRADHLFTDGVDSLTRNANLAASLLKMGNVPGPADLFSARQFRKLIHLSGPFDVIHSHSSKAGLTVQLGAACMAGIRVHTPHAPFSMRFVDTGHPLGLPARFFERWLSEAVNAVIAVSSAEKAHLAGLGVRESKIHIIPNGTNVNGQPNDGPARERARRSMEVFNKELIIGFVGRLVKQKNPGLLLSSFASLPHYERARCALVFVGKGPLEKELAEQARHLGVAELVRIVDPCDQATALVTGFDVFVLPSLYEGMPYVLLEAMLCQVPPIATRVGGAEDLIVDGDNGFLVPVCGAAALTARMSRLISSETLRASLGVKARVRALQNTRARMAQETEKLYFTLRRERTGC